MGEFMAEHIKNYRPRQPKEGDQPKHGAERKEPEFFTGPESLVHGGAGEGREKGLAQNRTQRHKKQGDDKFYPSRRHHEGVEAWAGPRGRNDVRNNFDPAHRLTPVITVHYRLMKPANPELGDV